MLTCKSASRVDKFSQESEVWGTSNSSLSLFLWQMFFKRLGQNYRKKEKRKKKKHTMKIVIYFTKRLKAVDTIGDYSKYLLVKTFLGD